LGGIDFGSAWRGLAGQGLARQGGARREQGMDLGRRDGPRQPDRRQKDKHMKHYQVTLTGISPLLLHRDNIDWAEEMSRWSMDPANKGKSIPGDDRTPAHRWMGCLYVQSGVLVIDSDNLMSMLRDGGAKCPSGKGKSTFKRATQSGIQVNEIGWPIVVASGQVVKVDDLADLRSEPDFDKHSERATSLGFSLFAKRARVNNSKHIRVRPRFDTWSASGTLTILDDSITKDVLQNILTHAGAYCGLCDWRPSSPKSPGPYGRFTAEIQEVK
jgi:hypothetical protein